MTHKAKKIVIITEKLILDNITNIIEECGATGYTVTAAGGKGSRGVRSERGNDAYSNVKIEVVTANVEMAKAISEKVANKYFENYSGITYIEDVEIIRLQKF